MSPDDVRSDAKDEMRLAFSALQAAEALIDLGLAPDAASRLYFAVFHAARALLFSIGIEPRSHQSVRNLFGRHFVRTGLVPAERARELAELEGLRSSGDYDSAFALTVEELRADLDRARAFVADAEATLATKGG